MNVSIDTYMYAGRPVYMHVHTYTYYIHVSQNNVHVYIHLYTCMHTSADMHDIYICMYGHKYTY